MERLTDVCWRNFDPWECCGQDHYCTRGCHDDGGCTKGCIVPRLYARLAAYEDTGLEPEEVAAIKRALMGQEIAKITEFDGIPVKHIIELAQAEKDGRLVVLPCKTGDTLWSFYNYPTKGICEIVVTAVSTLDGITVINTDNYGVLPEEAVGKTVFLTREEAEAALKKREEEDNETD